MKLTPLLLVLACLPGLFVRAQDTGDPAVQSKIIALEKAWKPGLQDRRHQGAGRTPRQCRCAGE